MKVKTVTAIDKHGIITVGFWATTPKNEQVWVHQIYFDPYFGWTAQTNNGEGQNECSFNISSIKPIFLNE
jgi:uncharacterized membrane protein